MSQASEDADRMLEENDMKAVPKREKIPAGYRLMTVAEAESYVRSSDRPLKSWGGVPAPFRLMNGCVDYEGHVEREYSWIPDYKLVRRSSGEEEFSYGEEDYRIALTYACEVDDVDGEVEGLVKELGGIGIFCKQFSDLIGGRTLVHHCAYNNSNTTLATVLRQLEERWAKGESQQIHYNLGEFKDVHATVADGRIRSYEDYKTGIYLILRHTAIVGGLAEVNNFLSGRRWSNQTALGRALREPGNVDASKGLLDASKQIFEDFETAQVSSVSPTWLTRRTSDNVAEKETTHLHLALVLAGRDASSAVIIDKILNFPGAKELNLTSLRDDIDENTPFHIAVVHCAGEDNQNTEILFKLLQYTSASLKCALDKLHSESDDDHPVLPLPVNAQNKQGETALHLASRTGFRRGCRMLLKHGASIQLRDEAGRYALTDALFCGDGGETARVLLNACTRLHYEVEDPIVAVAVRSHGMSSLVNAKFEFDLTPLHVAVAVSSQSYTDAMLDSGALLTARSEDGKTPLHLAMLQKLEDMSELFIYPPDPDSGPQYQPFCFELIDATNYRQLTQFTNKQDKINWINMRDYFDQTALHIAVLRCPPEVRGKVVERLCLQEGAFVDLKDSDGDTPLHLAARGGHEDIISILLLNECKYSCTDREKWIAMCNYAGETALHEAAKRGHKQIARKLIQQSKAPDELLLLRDVKNRTALQIWDVEKDNEALTMISELLESCKDEVIKHFLLWDTLGAATPGTMLHTHMKKLADGYSKHLPAYSALEHAVKRHDLALARELINRGADVTTLDYESRIWISRFLRKNVSDQPALEDTLGRKELVLAVAALLLNPYTGTPISIGVFGDWGMGKSSFMLQVEGALLCMAVKQNFRHTSASQSQHFLGSKPSMLDFSSSAAMLRHKVIKALYEGMSEEDIRSHAITVENAIETFPIKFHSQYTFSLLKELALVDRSKLVESMAGTHEWRCLIMLLFSRVYQAFNSLAKSKSFHSCEHRSISKSKHTFSEQHKQDAEQLIGHSPAIMTVHYNAWHYDDKTEAAAGLAVNISRELEDSMTPSQWLRMCFVYSWQSQRINIFMKLLLPLLVFFFAAFLVVLIWRVAPLSAEYKLLTLPVGILGVIWAFFKTFLQFIQPVTETIISYIKSPDHSAMLGYQQRVISDINFLIDQLCTESNFIWTVLGYLGQIFISTPYHIKGTTIGKQHPARRSNLRIVVFIDDLDRCEEKTVLEVLRAVNLILATCGINVLIGVDQRMVEHAVARELLKDASDKVLELVDEVEITTTGATHGELVSHPHHLAKRYLQKIIQLPVEMTEPTIEDLMRFLKRQVGRVYLHEEKAEYKNNTTETEKNVKTNQKSPGSSSIAQEEDEVMKNTTSTANQNTGLNSSSEIHGGNQNVGSEDMNFFSPHDQLASGTALGLKDHAKELVTIKENVTVAKDAMKEEKRKGHRSYAVTEDASSSKNVPTDSQGSRKDIHEGALISPCLEQAITVCVEKDWKGWTCFGAQENGNQRRAIDTMELHKTGVPMQKKIRLILTNYSPMEEDLILKLSESAKGDGKLPREWKRFLNYHRLCWSVLSQDHNMEKVEFNGWRRKLILWIFICWNWTEKINKIIEIWEDLLMEYSSNVPIWRSSSLGDIISFYIKKSYPNDKNSKSPNRNQEITKAKTSWIELLNTLKEQNDLSMRFLNVFQKFRFYCDRKALTIHEKYIMVSEGDYKERANLESILRLRHGEGSL